MGLQATGVSTGISTGGIIAEPDARQTGHIITASLPVIVRDSSWARFSHNWGRIRLIMTRRASSQQNHPRPVHNRAGILLGGYFPGLLYGTLSFIISIICPGTSFSTDMDFRKTAWSQWIDICADCYWLRMLCEQNPYLDLCCVGCMFRCSRFCFCIDRSALNVFILQRRPGTCALWKWNNRKNEECPPGWWAFLFCFANAVYSRIFVSRG